MEVAKVTSKGQITIPISIRRKLDINEGDKVLFIYKPDGVMMVNPVTFQGGSSDDVSDAALSEKAAVAASKKKPPKASAPVAAAKAKEDPVIEEPAAVEETVPEKVSRPAPPPVEEPEKPDTHVGGFNLNTLLDDIRSIGSNI